MLDVVEETLDGLVLKGDPKEDTLEASLDAYTKPNLIKLAESNDFDVKKSWNKDQMIEVISEDLRDSLDERLSEFEAEELAGLKDMLAGEVDLDNKIVASAVHKGLLYVSSDDDGVSATMPAEFEEKLDDVMESGDAVEVNEESAAGVAKPPVRTVPFAPRRQRIQPVEQRIVGEKVGRNDPCPCGSGKKYKKCHWLEDQRN